MLEQSDRPGEVVIRLPSFFQLVKAGFALTLGGTMIFTVGAVFFWFLWLGAIGTLIGGLSSSTTHARATAPTTSSRQAPATSPDFEQRVQRIQRDRADAKEDADAFGEALRREQASRRQPAK